MPSSQEIARVMAEMDRFNQSAKVTVTEERYEKRVASVGGSYGGLTALLQQGAPGNWASDHKSEAEKFAGWHYVAISSIGKAIRSANCEAYQEQVREYAKAYNEQDDDSEPLPKWHPLMKLLKRPNPSQSGASFREEVAIQLCLTGSALIWNVPNKMGRTVERYVIPTAIAEPRQPEPGRPRGGWYINPEVARWQIESGWFLYTGLATAIGKVIDARDVQVIRFIHPVFKDEGQSPVSAGALWTDTSEKVDISRHSHLRNGSDPSVIIGIDGVEDEGTLQRMSAKFNEKYAGPSKHGKAMFVNGQNVKVEPVTRTPAEMAYEGAFLQFRDAIMALHGVTPIAAGIEAPSGDDGLYAPLKQFISGTVQPILDLMAEEDTEQLAGQFGEGISVLYTAKAIDDAKLTEQQINTDIAAGAIEVDEIRKLRGRKPWGGEKGKAVAGQGAKEEPNPGLPGLAQGVPGLETKPNGLEPQTGSQALDPSKPPQGTPDPMKLAEEAVAKALGGFADRLSALLKSGDNCGTGAGGFKPGNDCASGDGSGGEIKDIRPAKENIDRVISSNFSAGARLIDLDVKAESVKPMLSGSVADREKVDRLKKQISSPSGYLERIIIDTDGNVIEGQHRATALKELGVKSIPATVLADLTPTFNKLTASGLRPEHARNIIDHAVEIHGDGDSVQDYDTGKYAQSYVLVEDDIKQHYEKASQLSSKNSKRQVKHIQKGYFRNKRKSSDCGANAEGGGGFQPGNTCGRGDGSGEAGGEGKASKKKPVKKGKAKGVLAWAEEKFGDPEKAKAFADWFGESKVVDEDGKPLTVYHGSKADIAGEFAFDPSKIGENASAEGYGFYFTTDKATASGYKPQDSGSLAEVYLRVEKPIDVNQKGFTPSELSGIISEMVDAEIARYPDEISDYKDGFLSNYVDTYSTKREAAIREVAKVVSSGSERAIEQIAELANSSGSKSLAFEAVTKATGFDGVQANGYGGRGEAGGTIYVAWYPTQIKAANNQGTFDPSNPNIYKSGSSCGANAQGGGGFQPGNTCGKRDGKGGESAEGGGKGAGVNPKILAWAREKFGDDTTAENFTKWFGDSKVVDADGNPLVVYHGTIAEFDTFDEDRLGQSTGHPLSKLGFYFSSEKVADRFTREFTGAGDFADPEKLPVREGAKKLAAFVSMSNPYIISAEDFRNKLTVSDTYDDEYGFSATPKQMQAFREKLKADGYDGIIVKRNARKSPGTEEWDSENYIVFTSPQIKSATGNSGTFDPKDPNITKSGSGCGANAEGGGGFQRGNTCGSREGGDSEGSGGSKPGKGGKVYEWALKKFKDEETARNFTKWFGDSKVVDQDGNPLTIYHGTTGDFTEFDPRASIKSGQEFGAGIYLTTDAERAALYANDEGGSIKPLYLKAESVLDRDGELSEAQAESISRVLSEDILPEDLSYHTSTRAKRTFKDKDEARTFYQQQKQEWDQSGEGVARYKPSVSRSTLGIDDEFVVEYSDKEKVSIMRGGRDAVSQLMRTYGNDYTFALSRAGVDAVKVGDIYVVTSPNQIKSATGNSGKFDPSSNDITKSSDCGANGPGGGGFQPGNTCGKEDGAGEAAQDPKASRQRKQKEKRTRERLYLETELMRATGWTAEEFNSKTEHLNSASEIDAWVKDELDKRQTGAFAEARKAVKPELDKLRAKVVEVWEKDADKISALNAEFKEAAEKHDQLNKKHINLYLAHLEMRNSMGNSEQERAELSKLGKEMDAAKKEADAQGAVARKIWEKKNKIPEKTREKIAAVLRKESARIAEEISPAFADQFKLTEKDIAEFVKRDYSLVVAGNSTEQDKKIRQKSLEFVATAANPEFHNLALKSAVHYKDGVRANANPGVNTERLGKLLDSGVPAKEAIFQSRVPSHSVYSPGDDTRTYIHELGHQIEFGNREAAEYAGDFLRRRTSGDEVVSFADQFGAHYRPDERGSDDEFGKAIQSVFAASYGKTSVEMLANYTGKIYSDGSTEVLSIGLELLHENPKAFAEADPEWFDLVSGVLTGRVLSRTKQEAKAKYQ